LGMPIWSLILYFVEAPRSLRVTLAKMFEDYEPGEKVDTFDHAAVRPRDNTTRDAHMFTAECLSLMNKCGHILMAGTRGVPQQEVLDGLPQSVDAVIRDSMPCTASAVLNSCADFMLNSFLYVAAVFVELGEHARALEYLDAALSPDLSKGGSGIPSTCVASLLMQGRAFAALGRTADAAASFEAAAEKSHCYQIWLFEAFALRDLKLSVLDEMGHGEHGSRRLGAALRKLTGPAQTLTPLLKGLNAAELMSLPEPDTEYEIKYAQDTAMVQLREELQSMKLLVLQRRFLSDTGDEAQLDAAMEKGNPKAAVVELIVQQHLANAVIQSDQAIQLRHELQILTLRSLQKRAEAAQLPEEQIDDAMESDDAKTALVELLVNFSSAAHHTPPRKPHFGSGHTAVGNTSVAPVSQQRSTKHVMLSYQWDHQRQVKRVHEMLTQLELNVWMDISGGMSTDVYESMAEGVSNASVVVCFMSQKYQESENCTLEAKF